MTNKQKNDIEVIKYFIPSCMRNIEITNEDIENFLSYSEGGKNKELLDDYKMDGFNALIQGKRWRGIHIHELYEQGILDGSVPYFTLLGGYDIKRKWWQFWKPRFYHKPIPRCVVDFLKKEMFKGKDAETIENTYQLILGK